MFECAKRVSRRAVRAAREQKKKLREGRTGAERKKARFSFCTGDRETRAAGSRGHVTPASTPLSPRRRQENKKKSGPSARPAPHPPHPALSLTHTQAETELHQVWGRARARVAWRGAAGRTHMTHALARTLREEGKKEAGARARLPPPQAAQLEKGAREGGRGGYGARAPCRLHHTRQKMKKKAGTPHKPTASGSWRQRSGERKAGGAWACECEERRERAKKQYVTHSPPQHLHLCPPLTCGLAAASAARPVVR